MDNTPLAKSFDNFAQSLGKSNEINKSKRNSVKLTNIIITP